MLCSAGFPSSRCPAGACSAALSGSSLSTSEAVSPELGSSSSSQLFTVICCPSFSSLDSGCGSSDNSWLSSAGNASASSTGSEVTSSCRSVSTAFPAFSSGLASTDSASLLPLSLSWDSGCSTVSCTASSCSRFTESSKWRSAASPSVGAVSSLLPNFP